MKLKEKFDSIDQSKLNADQKDFLSKIEKATKNFTSDNKEVNDKVEGALDKMIATFKEKMPEAIKTKAEKKEPKASAKKATSKSSEKPSRTNNGKRSVMSLAKEIRKDGESWADAQKRARAEMKKDKESATKEVKTEMEKLLAFIKTRKELEGISGTDLKRDSSREAKPRGRRISKDGNVYYENRENRIDRLAPNYPKDAPMLAKGGFTNGRYEVVKVIGFDKNGNNLPKNQLKVMGDFDTKREAIEFAYQLEMKRDVTQRDVFVRDTKLNKEIYADGGNVNKNSFLVKRGDRVIADFDSKKDAEKFIYDYGLRYPKAKLKLTDAPMLAGGGDVGKKLYYERMNVGKAKYTVNYHDGVKTHKDGSAFYDIAIFKNKKDLQDFISKLSKEGYKERSSFYEKGGYVAVTETKDDYWVIVSRPTSKKMAEEMAKIVTTKKDEKNKVVTLEQAKAHKKVLGKEYLDKFELGGNVGGYDLAGHLGGNFNVGQNDGMLDGTTGTQYSGLVGETGAMSSGEMFSKGGAVKNERQHINHSEDYEVRYAKNHPNSKRHGYGNLRFDDGGDFQAGVYARGGGVGDNVLGLKKGDVFQIIDEQHQASNSKYIFVDYVDKNGKIAIKAVKYPTKQGRKNIINYIFDLSNDGIKKIEVEKHEQGAYLTDPNFGDFQQMTYAMGGGLSTHGLKEGDQIIKTLSGGIQKVKDKKGEIVYVNLANGERSADIPLPFDDGGKVPEFIVNKDGIRVSKMVEPKKKLSEKEWMAKHNESKEARAYKYGGKLDNYSEFVQDYFPSAKREANKYSKKYKMPYIVVVEKNNQDRIEVRTLRDFLSFPKSYQESYDVLYETTIDYEHGGNLETNIKSRLAKNFNLPLEVAVYVPSTKDADKSISKKEFESRIKSVEKYLSGLFGGFSANDVDGGYMSQEKGLITEEVYKVISFAQRDGFSSKMEKLVAQIKKWAKDWGQESIGLEFEGDLFYIDQAGEYKLGGMMSKHYSTRTSSHINKGNFNRSLSNRYDNGGEIDAFSMRMVKGTNSEPDEVLTESQEVKFAKGGLITEEKLKEEEWFSPDGKVQFEYIQGRLRITLYYGKNRQYSTRTTINNASELSLKELNEQVKKEISHLKEFAERDLKRNFAGGGKVEKRQAYLDTLAGKESDIWDKLGAESGADIRQDKDMLRNYALKMEAMLKREEVGKGSFDEADYDHLADMNAHLMNEFLVWNNYYEPEMTVREKKWRTEKLKDPRYKIYVSDPKTITVSESSSSKNSKYIVHADIESITVKKDGKEIKIKGSDVLNGANLLKKGGDLSKSATYYPKRSIVSVKLKNGEIVHPANGYWVIKNPKMSRTQFEEESFEYEDGGDVRSDEERVERLMNKLNEDGKLVRFIDVRGNGKKVFESIIKNNGKEKTYKRYESSERGKLGVLQNSNLSESDVKHHLEKTLPKYEGGGKVSFAEKSKAIAKNFEGKRVEPKYQKEYGKTYDKAEAKEVGNKIAGAQKAKYDAKAEKGALLKIGYFKNEIENSNIDEINKYFDKWNNIKTEKDSENFKNIKPPMFGTYKNVTILEQISNFEKQDVPFGANQVLRNDFKKEVGKIISKFFENKAEKGAVVKKKTGNPNAGQSMLLAKKIRKDGEKWTDAVKRASAMLKAKK